VIWLRHHLRWAMPVAAVALIGSLASLSVGNWQYLWPVLIILIGAYLLYTAMRQKAT
jgi:divalent metal cation (Fe/Co/Zn/Cd) transporter